MKYINVIDAKEHFSNPALNPKRRQFCIAKGTFTFDDELFAQSL